MLKSIIPFILATITILCFQNCGNAFQVQKDVKQAEPGVVYVTDAEFVPYIQEFEYFYKESTSHAPIAFADLEEKIAGVCYRSFVGSSLIYAYMKIDKTYWPKMSEKQKINLIFHELGHCVLQRDHVSSDSVRECPSSFMHDTVMSDYCLDKYYDDYIKEMFP